MAMTAYIKIDGIATEKLNGIELESFSWGVSNSATVGESGSGTGAGRASFHDFAFTAPIDSHSPLLFAKCAEGEIAPSATLTVVGTNFTGALRNQIMVKFGDVLFSSYKIADKTLSVLYKPQTNFRTAESEAPVEHVTFNFSRVSFTVGGNTATGGGNPVE